MKEKVSFVIVFFALIFGKAGYCQNIESIEIEKVKDKGIIIPAQCSPEDMIVLIISSIEGLIFESNLIPDTAFTVIFIAENNQYIICHEKEKFILTVSGPNLQAEDISIFDLSESHVYRLTSNIHRGSVNIRTDPPNTSIVFPSLMNQKYSSEALITNNSGRYPIIIEKDKYLSIDTVISIPRDTTRTYTFKLTPEFAMLKIDITTEDNVALSTAPALSINGKRILMDGFIRPTAANSFYDDVKEFHLYENNIIPVPEGNYEIDVEVKNYVRFETSLFAQKGKVTNVPIMMELIFGYITFLDSINATGANIYLNDKLIGELPMNKARARAGINVVRFEKPGYMTDKPTYEVSVSESINADFWVNMRVSRTISVFSEPSASEVILNGNRIGFTPHTAEIPAGNHKLMVKKVGYSPQNFELIEKPDDKPEDTLFFTLYRNNPMTLKSERRNHLLHFIGLDSLSTIEISNPFKLDQDVQLPYGRYQLRVKDRNETITYKGLLRHEPNRKIPRIPSYSKSSFTFLTADYVDEKNIEAAFGRIHIFPHTGLSTSLINAQLIVFEKEEKEYETLLAYPFFLNWDWRLGGAVLRQLDICALGRAKFSPGIKAINNSNLFDYHDAQMISYFFGLEFASRLPVINFNFKIGQQIMDGELNIWDKDEKKYAEEPIKMLEEKMTVSFGVTIGGGISNSNNMLRLWRKPLVQQILDKYN